MSEASEVPDGRALEQIGVRELRQHASAWLRRVEAGESFEVTDRGRPVARLVPAEAIEGLRALRAAGRARPASGHLADAPPPIPPAPGRPTAGEILRQMRADER